MKLYTFNKHSIYFKEVSRWKIARVIIGVVLLTYIISIITNPSLQNSIEKIPIVILDSRNSFSEDKLKEMIVGLNLKHPDVIYAQAILESGNFKSSIFKNNNNLFGMKEARQRPTTALGTQLNHAYYDNWRDCVLDYAIWQSSYARRLTKEQYLDLLNEMYAEDNSYKDKLKILLLEYEKR